MGRLIVNAFSTIDGFYDAEDGTLGPIFARRWSGYRSIDEFDQHNLDLLDACDTLIWGRQTHVSSHAFWTSPEAPSSPVRQQLAARFRSIRKLVVGSHPLPDLDWGETAFVTREASVDAVRAVKAAGDSVVMMSRLLWNHLLNAGLVDELRLTVFPMALGKGRPLFSAPPQAVFRLKASQISPLAGNVLLVYDVLPPGA